MGVQISGNKSLLRFFLVQIAGISDAYFQVFFEFCTVPVNFIFSTKCLILEVSDAEIRRRLGEACYLVAFKCRGCD